MRKYLLLGLISGGLLLRGQVTSIPDIGGGGSFTPTVNNLNAVMICADAGATDAYACSLSPAIVSYTTGYNYYIKANTANTGGATANFNAIGAAAIVKATGGITTALVTGDILAGQWLHLVYDGTNFQLQSTLGNYQPEVMDEAVALTRRPTVNFTGAGVTCADNAGATRTDCTITSGSSGYTGPSVTSTATTVTIPNAAIAYCGNVLHTFAGPSVFTVTAGTGNIYVALSCLTATPRWEFVNNVTGTVTSGTATATNATTVIPTGYVLYATIPVTAGAVGSVTMSDGRAVGGSGNIVASTGISATSDAQGRNVVAATFVKIAGGTSALGTSAIASGACATTVTTSATGTLTTDAISASFNASPLAVTGYVASSNGMLTIISWPTADNVNFAVCNNTASSITPGAITLNWYVAR